MNKAERLALGISTIDEKMADAKAVIGLILRLVTKDLYQRLSTLGGSVQSPGTSSERQLPWGDWTLTLWNNYSYRCEFSQGWHIKFKDYTICQSSAPKDIHVNGKILNDLYNELSIFVENMEKEFPESLKGLQCFYDAADSVEA